MRPRPRRPPRPSPPRDRPSTERACSIRSAPARGRTRRQRCPGRGCPSGRASRRAARRAAAQAQASCRRVRRFRTWRFPPQPTATGAHRRPLFGDRLCRFPTPEPELEAGQVLLDLPGRDLLVVPRPLVAFHLDEVVDVVLVAGAAESLTQDVVAL